MTQNRLKNNPGSVFDSIDTALIEKYNLQTSPSVRQATLKLILSIDDFWLKVKMLAVIKEQETIYKLLKQQFIDASLTIVSKEDEIGIPIKLENLVDFVKETNLKESVIPGATVTKEEQIKDSIFFLVHPRHYKAAICCYEGMQLLIENIENKLAVQRVRKINEKSTGILMKFNHTKEIKQGFDYAMRKNYTHFMRNIIKQTGELACSKFKADYETKRGLEGWELAGWELINAIVIDIKQFPDFENIVQDELINRLNEAGVETHEIKQYISKCNFPENTKLKKKYDLIQQLEINNEAEVER